MKDRSTSYLDRNKHVEKQLKLKSRVNRLLTLAIILDLIISCVTLIIHYRAEGSVGDFSLKSLNYYEYFVSTPAFVASYIFIYRRLRAYHNNMIVRYKSLMLDEEVKILNRTNRDILIFFLCVGQYLVTRVVCVLLIIAIDHK